jgi:cellulose synthase/poly-beta-1,6-N-acetylglucosamine synthase-like glycosyltransferase
MNNNIDASKHPENKINAEFNSASTNEYNNEDRSAFENKKTDSQAINHDDIIYSDSANELNVRNSQSSSSERGMLTSFVDINALPEANLPGLIKENSNNPVIDEIPTGKTKGNTQTTLIKKLSNKFNKNYTFNSNAPSKKANVNYHTPIVRKRTFTKMERKPTYDKKKKNENNNLIPQSPWTFFAQMITCCIPSVCLKMFSVQDPRKQQAWREKIALVVIIFLLSVLLGFFSFGFQYLSCNYLTNVQIYGITMFSNDYVNIRGDLYDIRQFKHPGRPIELWKVMGRDNSWIFPLGVSDLPNGVSACDEIPGVTPVQVPCTVDNADLTLGHCHTSQEFAQIKNTLPILGKMHFEWKDIQNPNKSYTVYNSWVLDLSRYFNEANGFLGNESFNTELRSLVGKDSTMFFSRSTNHQRKLNCLIEQFKVGVLESQPVACVISTSLMNTLFGIIIIVIFVKFFVALIFNCTGFKKPIRKTTAKINRSPRESKYSLQYNSVRQSIDQINFAAHNLNVNKKDDFEENGILRTIMLVACYSEGDSLRKTLDSLANTEFPDSHKLFFIVADGMVTGAGNEKSTPDILIDMIELDPQFEFPPPAFSYAAVADGIKRHNQARVYAGRYRCKNHIVPVVLVVKCGAPEEYNMPKPGNRGKRDSQVLLMQFLSKALLDERMTPLEYDIFTKITAVNGPIGVPLDMLKTKVTPDMYDLVLMVDADTVVQKDSLIEMSSTMAYDLTVVGLCGETRIANKSDSIITMVQVYEYHINHILSKGFESFFGSVTCLPGCFCMYRIKIPKNNGYVPIFTDPDIIESYGEIKVNTLHESNLLMLGEDRYLTTLMLKKFPKRKLVFVPKAVCKTVVPDTFKVLLSQRRRWINSTVHNLLELVKLKDLCGIFCLSMQFLIALELIATAVLPASLLFIVYLLICAFIFPSSSTVPLIFFLIVCTMPSLLVVTTSKRWVYVLWMVVYLWSLPLWNLILPLYSFWHFDDFTWGETRKIHGDSNETEDGGMFDPTKIVCKRWCEFERERRLNLKSR